MATLFIFVEIYFIKFKINLILIFYSNLFTAQYTNVLPPPNVFDVEQEALFAELELVPTLQLTTTAELEWRMETFFKILH